METFIRIVVIVFFFVWVIATIVNQFDYPWVRKIQSFDICRILPRWTFFAPNPGTSDFHILYRQKDVEDNITDFTEIPLHGKRYLSSIIWNPEKRVKKVLLDLAITINSQIAAKLLNENNIKLSFGYIALLNFLSTVPLNKSTRYIQFVILESAGFIETVEPQLVICSEFHKI
jgi:hypothetical protein